MPTYKITDPETGRTVSITGDSPPSEQELNEIFSSVSDSGTLEPISVPEPSIEESTEKSSLIETVGRGVGGLAKETGRFVKGAVTQPIQTATGLIKGAGTATLDMFGRPISKGLAKLIPGEDIFQRAVEKEKEIVAAGGERFQYTPKGRTQERAAEVGKFATKAGTGGALAVAAAPAIAAVGVTGLPATLAGGTVANLPFLPEVFEEGGAPGAIKDIALNIAIDALTFGASKALPLVKARLIKRGVSANKVDDIAADALRRAKDLPSASKVKKTAETGFDIEPPTRGSVDPELPTLDISDIPEKVVPSAAPPKKLGEKLFGRIDQSDRSILSEQLKATDTPFTEYAEFAEAAIVNPRNPTPLDIAARKGTEAGNLLKEKTRSLGKRKGEILANNLDETVDLSDTQNLFSELIKERLGLDIDDAGKIIGTGRAPTEKKMVNDIAEIFNTLTGPISVRDADNIKAALRDIVDEPKALQVKPRRTVTESIVDKVRKDIDDKLSATLGPEFKKVNKEFAQTIDLGEFLEKKLGAITDPETGQRIMGASLLKSSLQSNSDRGSKALFERIRKETQIDLIKEAKFAEIAMKAVDDPRIKSLLQEIGITLPGKLGVIQAAAGKVADVARPDKLSETIIFFNKQQQKVAKKTVKSTAPRFSDEELKTIGKKPIFRRR